MKSGAFFLAFMWFTGAVFAGYGLTERSFAWIDEPDFGIPVASDKTPPEEMDFAGTVPPELLERAKDLTPKQMACLQAAAQKCLE